MKDFFISYTQADKEWAEWIAWTLEGAGYSVVLQAWDFAPGSNFVLEMDRALRDSQRLILVLTDAYIQSAFSNAEWAAGLVQDPTGQQRKVVPVRVAQCDPPGLLQAIHYIDLVGHDEEGARQVLLAGLENRRMKPPTAPSFPGRSRSRTASSHPSFPAVATPRAISSASYVPRLGAKASDLDIQRFVRASFDDIRRCFTQWSEDLKRSNNRLHTELQQVSSEKFIAQVYVDDDLRCNAKIWLGSPAGSRLQIGYYEGRSFGFDQDNQFNDTLAAEADPDGLHLKALMAVAAYLPPPPLQFDPQRMTSNQAAEYLWRRFLARLGN